MCVFYLTEIKIHSKNLEIILVLVEVGLELGSIFFFLLIFGCAGSSLLCIAVCRRWGLRASVVAACGSFVVAPGPEAESQ